ncbi:hypothetical protein ABPG74_016936, partial [Tetrahymena malaccensis]
MIKLDLSEETPTVQYEDSQTQYLNQNQKSGSCESLEDSFEYVDCDYKFIQNSSDLIEEDEYIINTKIVLQKNKDIISQLEAQEIKFDKIYEKNTEINSLEIELNSL